MRRLSLCSLVSGFFLLMLNNVSANITSKTLEQQLKCEKPFVSIDLASSAITDAWSKSGFNNLTSDNIKNNNVKVKQWNHQTFITLIGKEMPETEFVYLDNKPVLATTRLSNQVEETYYFQNSRIISTKGDTEIYNIIILEDFQRTNKIAFDIEKKAVENNYGSQLFDLNSKYTIEDSMQRKKVLDIEIDRLKKEELENIEFVREKYNLIFQNTKQEYELNCTQYGIDFIGESTQNYFRMLDLAQKLKLLIP